MLPELVSVDLPGAPVFARLDEYSGAWAMEPSAFRMRLEALQRMDLAAHANHVSPRLLSQAEKIPTKGGKSIAVIKVLGTMMKQQSSMEQSSSTVQVRRDIRNAVNDDSVAGILLAIDSPGGTVAGTDDLAGEVRAANKLKPVWAFIDDMGASAAYYVASQAAKIFANAPTALIGSIGTIAVIYDLSAMAEKEGIKANIFATGPLKGAGVPGAPLNEDQAAYFQGIVDQSQQSFDAAVKRGRGLTDKQLTDVRSGGVYLAGDALDRKLIDGIQSFDATLEQLATAARKQARDQKMLTSENQTAAAAPTSEPVATPTAAEPVQSADQLAQQIRERAAAEYARQDAIRDIAARYGLDRMTIVEGGQERQVSLVGHAIAQNWDATRTEQEAVRAARLEATRRDRPAGPAIVSRSHDRDCSLQALQGAMVLRAGGRLDHPSYRTPAAISMKVSAWLRQGINDANRNQAMEAAHRYADMSAVDICREALRLAGRDAPSNRHDLVQAAFSGGTLTNIFTDSVNARLLASYAEAGDTTQGWTQETEVADFKTNTDIALSKTGSLTRHPRGHTADHMNNSDEAETYKLARYTGQITVDEQDIIDDNLGAIAEMPVEMGMAAARLRPDLVYAILLANPTLAATARELFNATDDNLDTTSALAAATLKVGIANMNVKRQNGVNLNLNPTHLIVPSTLRFLGRELAQSPGIVIAGTAGAVTERGTMNTLQGENLTMVSDARLENGVTDPSTGTAYAGSASTWYLACAIARTILVAYLRGSGRAPRTRSFVLDKGQYGMGWDISHDIGAKARDYKGLYRATA